MVHISFSLGQLTSALLRSASCILATPTCMCPQVSSDQLHACHTHLHVSSSLLRSAAYLPHPLACVLKSPQISCILATPTCMRPQLSSDYLHICHTHLHVSLACWDVTKGDMTEIRHDMLIKYHHLKPDTWRCVFVVDWRWSISTAISHTHLLHSQLSSGALIFPHAHIYIHRCIT